MIYRVESLHDRMRGSEPEWQRIWKPGAGSSTKAWFTLDWILIANLVENVVISMGRLATRRRGNPHLVTCSIPLQVFSERAIN